MENNITQEITLYSKELRLPSLWNNYESAALEAAREKLSFEQYLHGLLQGEYRARAEKRKKTRIRQAGFPQLKHLQDLSREDLPGEAQERLPQLERLDFIRNGRKIFAGQI